jgi:hypothetical protein
MRPTEESCFDSRQRRDSLLQSTEPRPRIQWILESLSKEIKRSEHEANMMAQLIMRVAVPPVHGVLLNGVQKEVYAESDVNLTACRMLSVSWYPGPVQCSLAWLYKGKSINKC